MRDFKSFLRESQTTELLEHLRSDVFLQESVLDLFSKVVAQVKNSDGPPKGVDLTQLATMMTFLKIMGNKDHQAAMTKDDIGIDPKDIKGLYDMLNKVKGTGTQDGDVEKIVQNVVRLAPSELHRTEEDVKKLQSEDPTERKTMADRIAKFYTNLQAAMSKMKTVAAAGGDASAQKPGAEAAEASLAKQ